MPRPKLWINTQEGIAAAKRLSGTLPVTQGPAPTTIMAIEDPARYGAQWGCLEEGCTFSAPVHSKAAERHPASHRPARLTDADRKRRDADIAKANAIHRSSILCECGRDVEPGSVHACPRSPNADQITPADQAVAEWKRSGLKSALAGLDD